MRRLTVVLGALALVAATARADITLPRIFGDHMVLQRDGPAPVWGSASPGEKVTVRLGNKVRTVVADEQGRWKAVFDGLAKGGPYTLSVKGRKDPVVFEDVLVGEVWICSGQSNMAMTVSASRDAKQEIAAAKYPGIRLITVPRRPAVEPQSDFKGAWAPCSPETVGTFSAVGYFFGRALHRETGVPIGLVNTSYGGTPSEAWTRLDALREDGGFAPLLERWKTPVSHAHRPGNLYNGMIAPLVGYGIRGAIWYQGESNAGRAEQYRTLFPALIENWRADWDRGDFPFYYVQLANFRAAREAPGPSAWAELRDAQLAALSLPNTGMAVTIDIGDAGDIHPKNKQDVGARLARWALARDYGKKVVPSGPLPDGFERRGSEMVVKFRFGEGLATSDGKPPSGFSIAGEDREFVRAEARIEGETVVVFAEGLAEPVSVRYAWADNPVCNLVNGEGLPASPFRTDGWPGTTAGKD